jgi:TusA-related sulfurtransferase
MSQHEMGTPLAYLLAAEAANPDASLDLRGTPCPINFVRTKLQLEKMAPGALLEVWLDRGEPIEQVPDSLKMEGYLLESLTDCSDYFALQVRRPK